MQVRMRARVCRTMVWLLAACGVLVGTGCVQVTVESAFESDGVRHSIGGAIDRGALRQLEQTGLDTRLLTEPDAARQLAEARGLTYEPIDTAEQIGARFSRTFSDGSDVGASLTALLGALVPEGGSMPAGVFTGTFTSDGEAWTFALTVDVDRLLAAFGAPGDGDASRAVLDQVVDLTYEATFPGRIQETNGTRLDDRQVRWDLAAGGVTRLSAAGVVSAGDGGSTWWLVLLFGGGIVALGLVLGYWWATRRRALGG